MDSVFPRYSGTNIATVSIDVWRIVSQTARLTVAKMNGFWRRLIGLSAPPLIPHLKVAQRYRCRVFLRISVSVTIFCWTT
jgi:hypothetical protein